MYSVIIVVPLYKPFTALSKNEINSLRQLKIVLNEFPVCFIVPEGLLLNDYVNFYHDDKLSIEKFKDKFFQSKKTYSHLCLSKSFYKRFFKYSYMLIYQLDSYVFKNELRYWVQQGYDFIGAPIFKNYHTIPDKTIWMVGNGGFSLRSVQKCYKLVKKIHTYKSFFSLLNKAGLKKISSGLFKITSSNYLYILKKITDNYFNEDYVFGVLSKEITKNFKVAPVETAVKFSFEGYPRYLYMYNLQQLPFGCHGWGKFEPEFWSKFIRSND